MKHKFLERIEREYKDYKSKMLLKSAENIFDSCCEIYFYCSIYEYFMYNEAISYTVADRLGECENIIAGCWNLYLKSDALSILSWEDIGTIIEIYLQMNGGYGNGN